MVERLFLDRVDAKTGGATIGAQHHFAAEILAHEAEAALTFAQLAVTRTEVALDACVVFIPQRVPPLRGMGGFRGFQVSFHFCTP